MAQKVKENNNLTVHFLIYPRKIQRFFCLFLYVHLYAHLYVHSHFQAFFTHFAPCRLLPVSGALYGHLTLSLTPAPLLAHTI